MRTDALLRHLHGGPRRRPLRGQAVARPEQVRGPGQRGRRRPARQAEDVPNARGVPVRHRRWRGRVHGESRRISDIAGNYAIVDAGTGEEVVVLDEDFSLFVENWTVRDPDTGEALATIRSKSKLLCVLRHVVGVANLVPNRYEILNADGDHVGDVRGQFSLRDTYTVTVDDASDVPREAVVAAACVLDALEDDS